MREALAVHDARKKSMFHLMRVLCYTFVGLVLFAGCLVGFFTYITRPPRDTEVIANFHAHRRAFEHLRDMIQTDRQVIGVNTLGVRTAGPDDAGPAHPRGQVTLGSL